MIRKNFNARDLIKRICIDIHNQLLIEIRQSQET